MNPCTITATDEKVLTARANLKSRVMALEDRVTVTVNGACETVNGAAQTVRSTVEETTGTVHSLLEDSKEKLTDALDLRRQIRQHPWEGAGLAVAAGFLAGVLAARSSSQEEKKVVAEPRRGPLGELLDFARRELTGVAEAAIAAAAKSLRKNVEAVAVDESQAPWKSRAERPRSNGVMHANGQSL
jgi:ElaB/YqjD/DUF883 family membrane-anchored ribosome-binding protein